MGGEHLGVGSIGWVRVHVGSMWEVHVGVHVPMGPCSALCDPGSSAFPPSLVPRLPPQKMGVTERASD